MTIDEALKELKKIKRFSPFFLDKRIGEVIKAIENAQPINCGHCKYLTEVEGGVFYCWLYNIAKPWEGFCEKGEER